MTNKFSEVITSPLSVGIFVTIIMYHMMLCLHPLCVSSRVSLVVSVHLLESEIIGDGVDWVRLSPPLHHIIDDDHLLPPGGVTRCEAGGPGRLQSAVCLGSQPAPRPAC